MAHELGHLKCDHGVWLTFANMLTLGAYSVPGRSYLLLQFINCKSKGNFVIVLNANLWAKVLMILRSAGLGGLIAQSLEEQLHRWLRAAELTCDRAALLVAQDPKVLD